MPHLEKLKIKCCNPLFDLVYVNVYQWIKLIDLLTKLKELILIVIPKKTINEIYEYKTYHYTNSFFSCKGLLPSDNKIKVNDISDLFF
jgi:hypothetical protein